ncbi:MAG: phytanoyl-CoA dioxygenase [Coxiella sp. (in: Bacteria)]|nr:MAG: phytanoyl-CoA dioxygenase [Coxiella sp. (in: g-proteobacteria)]
MQLAATYKLNTTQRQSWAGHGYVVLRDFFEADVCDALDVWTEELAQWPETPGKWMKYFETDDVAHRQLCRIENFMDYHEGWHQVLNDPALMALLEDLFGEPAVLFKEKINFKLPGGAGFLPHQDGPAFRMFGQDYHITLMIAVDRATVDNGCLQVARDGQHQRGLLKQASDGSLAQEVAESLAWTPVACEPGDIILFDSNVPHFSAKNDSAKSRRALYVTYNKRSQGDKRSEYYKDKRDKFPPECERDPKKDYNKHSHVYNLGNPIE